MEAQNCKNCPLINGILVHTIEKCGKFEKSLSQVNNSNAWNLKRLREKGEKIRIVRSDKSKLKDINKNLRTQLDNKEKTIKHLESQLRESQHLNSKIKQRRIRENQHLYTDMIIIRNSINELKKFNLNVKKLDDQVASTHEQLRLMMDTDESDSQ